MHLTYNALYHLNVVFSHNCSISVLAGLLVQVLRFLVERPTEPHSIFHDPPFRAQRCFVTSRPRSNLEGVSRDVQSNQTVAA